MAGQRWCEARESQCLHPECSKTRCLEAEIREEHNVERIAEEALQRLLNAADKLQTLRPLVRAYEQALDQQQAVMEKHLPPR